MPLEMIFLKKDISRSSVKKRISNSFFVKAALLQKDQNAVKIQTFLVTTVKSTIPK